MDFHHLHGLLGGVVAKNAGKIGVFGDVACIVLLLFGEVQKPRSAK